MDLIELDKSNPNRHPWEISRAQSLLALIKNNPKNFQYADIGSGDLFFAGQIPQSSDKPVYAVDNRYAKAETKDNLVISSSTENIPRHSVDCAFLLDVMEHVEDETGLINTLKEISKPEAVFIITVPAHMFLFSRHDKFLGHFRRYDRKAFIKLMESNGFCIEECFYFFTSLVLPRIFENLKIIPHKEKQISGWKFHPNHILTFLAVKILNADFAINRMLARLQLSFTGLSICMICSKVKS